MCKIAPASLYDTQGLRLYLTPEEREDFLTAALDADQQTRTFCSTLHITGLRISEALSLKPQSIDFGGRVVVVETNEKTKYPISNTE